MGSNIEPSDKEATAIKDWADAMLNAWHTHAPKPAKLYPKATMLEAYAAQQHYISSRPSIVSGYKAALTNTAAQNAFGMDYPIAGVLFTDGQIDNNAVINSTKILSPLIETEIGFTVRQDIKAPISTNDVSALLLNWIPMVEIADSAFTSRPSIGDIVASNSLAACYLKPDLRFETSTAKDVVVELYRDNELLHQGFASEAMGNPLESAVWLINHTLQQGHSIKAGQFLMTGSLGAAHSAQPGHYRAEYKGLHDIEFGTLEFSFPQADHPKDPT